MTRSKHPDLSCNQTIREAIRKIAWKGMVSQSTGAINGTGKVTGYVAKIHTDDELAGTIDVQEYVQLAVEETEETKQGYHEGVLLSAIQDNSKGLVIIPKMYSDVIVSQDPETGAEYVTMYSHVDVIQLDAHETITVGVKEREAFDESDEESPDVDELEETGVFTKTTYTKDSITSEVHKSKDADASTETLTGEKYELSVDDGKTTESLDKDKFNLSVSEGSTTISADKDQIDMKRENAEVTIKSDKAVAKVGGSSVAVKDGTVYVGSESGTDNAVLGQQLASILSDFLQYMGQVMTTTMMGPQPPINVASFVALKAKVDAYKASQSGFLTKKVMIQK